MSSPNTNKKIMLPKTCMKLPCRNRQVISVSGAGMAPVLLPLPPKSAAGTRPAVRATTSASPGARPASQKKTPKLTTMRVHITYGGCGHLKGL
jgi:hypothetical protein